MLAATLHQTYSDGMDLEGLIIAWIAWTMSFCAWSTGIWFANRIRSGPLLIVMFVLMLSMILRPPIILLGLDYPIPAAWFNGYEYYTIAAGCLIATIWIILFLGFFVLARAIGAPSRGFLPLVERRLPIGPLSVGTFLVVGLATSLTIFLTIKAGGVAQFQFAVKIDKSLAGLYILRQINTIGLVMSILVLAYFSGKTCTTVAERKIRRHGILFAASLLLLGFANNYAWANRYIIAIALLGTGVMWHLHVKRISLLKAGFLGMGVFAVLQSLRALRFSMFSDVAGRNVDPNFNFWTEISLSLHLQEFDAMLLAIRDVGERFDFREGQDFVNGFLSWIPRFLYPSKEPFDVGLWLRQAYDPTQVNGWPPSIPAAWYVNFGSIGVILGTLISGVVLAIFDAHYRDTRNPWNATMGAMLTLLMAGAGIQTGFPQQIVLTFIPIWLLSLGLRATPRRIAFSRQDYA